MRMAGFNRSARTSLAPTWEGSWEALLHGCRRFESFQARIPAWPDPWPVASLDSWPFDAELRGRARALAWQLGRDMAPVHRRLMADNPGLRVMVLAATSHGEPDGASFYSDHLAGLGPAIGPDAAEGILCDRLSRAFREGLEASCPAGTISAACGSACVAAGLAAARIRSGICDACFVVALDAFSRVAHAGFRQIGALSPTGCRPFDRRRDGTTIGEAGAVLLLAAGDVALPEARRWTVAVEGFGQSCDARHPVEPSVDGVCDAVRRALAEAGRSPRDVTAVYWHGTGTVQNDRTEAEAARRLFGDEAPIGSATKGSFGHAMGASAALSILAAGETIRSRLVPPTAGLEEPAFPNLRLAQASPAEAAAGPALVLALGFGGINSALLLGPA
jgi:3-oxoacyl-[acyl-carrier-protein] synthase II